MPVNCKLLERMEERETNKEREREDGKRYCTREESTADGPWGGFETGARLSARAVLL